MSEKATPEELAVLKTFVDPCEGCKSAPVQHDESGPISRELMEEVVGHVSSLLKLWGYEKHGKLCLWYGAPAKMLLWPLDDSAFNICVRMDKDDAVRAFETDVGSVLEHVVHLMLRSLFAGRVIPPTLVVIHGLDEERDTHQRKLMGSTSYEHLQQHKVSG